ncbi:SRPBCC family protein [Salinibius halmophilus]|uniref:SRPBCC family protein n=1 Tax=Salinibius halmophilus TaxID=1853216 RepID=UPI000E6734D1|nr:SRPBCC family protein [Salinibius halmophilus]
MIGWDDEIDINVDAKVAFAAACDLSQAKDWVPAIDHIEPKFEGRLQTGDKWIETRTEGKRQHTMELTAFEVSPPYAEPPYVHCAGANVSGMKSYYRFIFEPIGVERCRVRLQARVETESFIKKLVARVMVKVMQRSDANLLEQLKDYLESS